LDKLLRHDLRRRPGGGGCTVYCQADFGRHRDSTIDSETVEMDSEGGGLISFARDFISNVSKCSDVWGH